MNRLPDWPARLHAFIDSIKRDRHTYGTLDCVVGFASGAVEALTGNDLAASTRGRYKTARGALGAMKRAGHANTGDLLASYFPEIHVSQASLGDLAAIPDESPFGYAIGLVNGERLLVMREDGLGSVDLFSAKRAYRVG